jgi:micrococcal nuclease
MKMRKFVLVLLLGLLIITGCSAPATDTSTSTAPVSETESVGEQTEERQTSSNQQVSGDEEDSQKGALTEQQEVEFVLVERVVDGDTIIVDGGKRVRLIGIDTPETVKPGAEVEPFGPEASAFTKEMLEGRYVYLEKDVSETDPYDRFLRYVYLEDGTFFNALIVEQGLAEVTIYPPDDKYEDLLKETEEKARKVNIGLWSAK